MEKDTYLLIKEEGKEKKRSKKLDWIIYGLAVISFVLMVIVIIHNNKTSIQILEPEKTAVSQKQEKTQEDLLVKEQEAEKQKQLLAQKQAEEQKLKEAALVKKTELPKETIKKTTQPIHKVSKTSSSSVKYNWKSLSRYPVKPDSNLTVAGSYTVKTGDALWKIAEKMNVKTINIIAVNGNIHNPNFILPGQVILLPNK